MLLGVDVLARVRKQAETLQSLASVVDADELETKTVLELLVREGLVSVGSAGYDASSQLPLYLATPAGEDLYGRILDRWALELIGPQAMAPAERFLVALAQFVPPPGRGRLLDAAEALPDGRDGAVRSEALALARAAVVYAKRTLESDPRGAAAAAGLRSLTVAEAEDLGYVAQMLRDSYRAQLSDEQHLRVVDRAAAACEAAWELRLLGPRDPRSGISQPRTIDYRALHVIADEAAAALAAAKGDPVSQALALVTPLRPRMGA